MICAEDEIGTGTSHGIIVLPDTPRPALPPHHISGLGERLGDRGRPDPNRVDAASHYGVARDSPPIWLPRRRCASSPVRAPSSSSDRPDGAVTVRSDRFTSMSPLLRCDYPRHQCGREPQMAPRQLTAVGQRPINNIVDITNYILLGLGQPLHCFDLAKVADEKIVVRTCPEGTPSPPSTVWSASSTPDLMICSAARAYVYRRCVWRTRFGCHRLHHRPLHRKRLFQPHLNTHAHDATVSPTPLSAMSAAPTRPTVTLNADSCNHDQRACRRRDLRPAGRHISRSGGEIPRHSSLLPADSTI